jgi:uncharacterized membrane protein HdeD (DUF308 family)
MRFRSLNRHDAWRAMPQTLVMRGIGMLILATCGLAWPDLALTMTLVDVGIICAMFAAVDLLIAASIRSESNRSARKIGLLGALGGSCGVLMMTLPLLRLNIALALVMLWLLATGGALTLWGASFGRRARSSGIIAQLAAGQFLLAFALASVHPTRTSGLAHVALTYAFILSIALLTLGLSLRREKVQRQTPAAELEAIGET